jgi:VWFA-related protein
MGRLILLVFVVVAVIPAAAARRVTVGQLEQFLAADQTARRTDAAIARQFADVELSERLTDATLGRLAARFALGPRTALALQLLSDQSAFLDPPAGELPATALPDATAQLRMLDLARGYAVERWSHLPDFFVTRLTNRFEDSPQVLETGGWPVRAGLHPVGSSNRQITFRDGQEVQDPTSQATSPAAKASEEIGLHTWGEFGPALSVVLTDTAKGTLSFSHWETAATGLVAVFRYEVPRAASHYTVRYCCQFDEHLVGRTQFGYGGQNRSAQQVANIPRADDTHTFTEVPAYKGELSIDPASGAVIRITLEADLKSGGPLTRAATMVEYAPIRIGDRSFICPVRSLALSVHEPAKTGHTGPNGSGTANIANDSEWQGAVSGVNRNPVLMLNETRFISYHRLGTTMHIVNDSAGVGGPASNPPQSGSQSAPTPETPSQVPASPAQRQGTEVATNAPSTEAPASPALPPPPAAPVIPEISMSAANSLPDTPVKEPQPQEPGYSIKVTSRLVDVGVIVTDKKGRPVRDLKPTDFEIYDNGQKQEIRAFTESMAPATPPAIANATSSQAPPENTFSNRTASDPTLAAPAQDSGSTILLIDESHVAWSDMLHAREEMLKFLASLAPGESVGVYVTTRTGFRILAEITSDHAALAARLKTWAPVSQSVQQAQDEEMRNRQQFDEVHNVSDLNSVNGNQIDVPDSSSTADPLLRSMGSNPAMASLVQLVGVARHLSAIPGHKSLVWVSSDNVFADWENQAVGIDKSPKMIDSFALRAEEAMNEAHVAVYPFDVSQLEGGAINADIRNRNVELNQAAADTAPLAGSGGGRNMTPGRITASMQQDIHPIQGPVRQVAAATGGRIIRRSGDLAGELAGIVDDGHATYMLSFSPSGPADGQYHNIVVKLNGKHGVAFRYRTGYLFEKEPSTLKERFQQAVWRPMDVNEIAVVADVAADPTGTNVKVNISAADLGFQQQADRWLDKLDIFFIQRDDEGRHAQVEGQTLGLRLKSSTYQRLMPSGVPFEHFVRMRQGMASLRVLVVDENSGRMGSVTIPAPAMNAGHP